MKENLDIPRIPSYLHRLVIVSYGRGARSRFFLWYYVVALLVIMSLLCGSSSVTANVDYIEATYSSQGRFLDISTLNTSRDVYGYTYEQPWISIRNTLRSRAVNTFGECAGSSSYLLRSAEASPSPIRLWKAREAMIAELREAGAQSNQLWESSRNNSLGSSALDTDGVQFKNESITKAEDEALCVMIESINNTLFNWKPNANFLTLKATVTDLMFISRNLLLNSSQNTTSVHRLQCAAGQPEWSFNVERFCGKVANLSKAVTLEEREYSRRSLSQLYNFHNIFKQLTPLVFEDTTLDAKETDVEFVFTICNFLFPMIRTFPVVSATNQTVTPMVPTCSQSCRELRTMVALGVSLDLYKQLKSLPTTISNALSHLQNVWNLTCTTKKGNQCVTVDNSTLTDGERAIVRRTLSHEITEDFALPRPKINCPDSFIETNNTSRYLSEMRSAIRQEVSARYHLTLSFEQIDKLFPCAPGCVSSGFSDDEHTLVKTITAIVSWLVLITSLASCLVYFSNMTSAKMPAHRRLQVALNITYFVNAVGYCPSAFDSSKDFYCFEDGAMRQEEPKTSFWCSFFGACFYAGAVNMSFLFACLSYHWLCIVKKLRGVVVSGDVAKKERQKFRVYILISIVPTTILTTAVLAMRKINALPLTGTCAIGLDKLFYLMTLPVMVPTGLSVILLMYGFGHLYFLRMEVINTYCMNSYPINSFRSSSVSNLKQFSFHAGDCENFPSQKSTFRARTLSKSSSNTEALGRLIVQLLVYIVAVLSMAIANISLGVRTYVQKDEFTNGVFRAIACEVLEKPYGKTAQCPPIPRLSLGLILVLMLTFGGSGLIMCTWILTDEARYNFLAWWSSVRKGCTSVSQEAA